MRSQLSLSLFFLFLRADCFLLKPRTPSTSTRLFDASSDDNRLLETLQETFEYEGRLPTKLEYRCGFCSILGAPNMGKSTLMNAIIQEDLCITTRRPQTTRHAILGVVTTNSSQLLLVDTPGILETPAYKLQEGMMEAVMGAFHDADVLMVVTDLFSTPIPDDELFAKVVASRKPTIVVINKIDLAEKVTNTTNKETATVPQAVLKWRSILPNAVAILPVSASEGPNQVGVVALRKLLLGGPDVPAAIRDLGRPIPGMFGTNVKTITDDEAKALLPISPPLYDEETLTDRSERFFASELIRSALFQTLKKELPYCCEVRVTQFKEPSPQDKKQVIRMEASILVERDSQKVIVIGRGGEQIKKVGSQARLQLEDFFQTKVFLNLSVKVDKDWRRNEGRLKEYGYLKKKKGK